MKAHVFAHLNNLPLIVVGYHQLKIGPYLRREKSKRRYRNYFIFQKNLFIEFKDKLKIRTLPKASFQNEPVLEKKADIGQNDFLFCTIPHWSNYFDELNEYRALVKKILLDILSPAIKKYEEKLTTPIIGVHMRMGDFRKLLPGEDFSKAGATRTPENYFLQTIEDIRKINGTELPVIVFSDGEKQELMNILSMPGVSLSEGNPDIVDLLLLSRSKIIIASASSTFSYWAGFLSDAPIILHPEHISCKIRLPQSENLYEGPLNVHDEKLYNYIKAL
ncbi:MAG TPA: alpha-1,2-fucosyltransferase [Puia sp.]|nr:alpha-1,2-fucosyltransferase [Puia sp.]